MRVGFGAIKNFPLDVARRRRAGQAHHEGDCARRAGRCADEQGQQAERIKVGVEGADGSLSIDRMKLRDALYATKGYKGMTGTLNCDQYGDCADPAIAVYKTTIENIKKGEMPTTPFWKP